MTGSEPLAEGGPPGLLRVFTIFHEAEALGASVSFLRAAEPLSVFGWTATGWLPGQGPLRTLAEISPSAAAVVPLTPR